MESILILFRLIIQITFQEDIPQPMTVVKKCLTNAQVQVAVIITPFLETRMILAIQKQDQKTTLSEFGSVQPKQFSSIRGL